MALLDRLKGILFEPRAEWPKIAAEPATTQSIYTNWVMILAAIGPLAILGSSGETRVQTAVGLYLLALIVTFILALVIDALATSFGGAKDFVAALKLAAYSYTVAWVAGVFQLLGIAGAVLVLMAVVYSWYTLYVGAPVLEKCALNKAAPFTIIVVLCRLVLEFSFGIALSGLGIIPKVNGMPMLH
jgi:Yip1-like protein